MVARQPITFATRGLPVGDPPLEESLRREVTVDASIDIVWRALTDPADLAVWLGAHAEIEARRGGAIRFRWSDGTERRGVVVELDPPRRLSFRWRVVRALDGGPGDAGATVVTFELRPDGDATRVAVTESPGVLPELHAEATS